MTKLGLEDEFVGPGKTLLLPGENAAAQRPPLEQAAALWTAQPVDANEAKKWIHDGNAEALPAEWEKNLPPDIVETCHIIQDIARHAFEDDFKKPDTVRLAAIANRLARLFPDPDFTYRFCKKYGLRKSVQKDMPIAVMWHTALYDVNSGRVPKRHFSHLGLRLLVQNAFAAWREFSPPPKRKTQNTEYKTYLLNDALIRGDDAALANVVASCEWISNFHSDLVVTATQAKIVWGDFSKFKDNPSRHAFAALKLGFVDLVVAQKMNFTDNDWRRLQIRIFTYDGEAIRPNIELALIPESYRADVMAEVIDNQNNPNILVAQIDTLTELNGDLLFGLKYHLHAPPSWDAELAAALLVKLIKITPAFRQARLAALFMKWFGAKIIREHLEAFDPDDDVRDQIHTELALQDFLATGFKTVASLPAPKKITILRDSIAFLRDNPKHFSAKLAAELPSLIASCGISRDAILESIKIISPQYDVDPTDSALGLTWDYLHWHAKNKTDVAGYLDKLYFADQSEDGDEQQNDLPSDEELITLADKDKLSQHVRDLFILQDFERLEKLLPRLSGLSWKLLSPTGVTPQQKKILARHWRSFAESENPRSEMDMVRVIIAWGEAETVWEGIDDGMANAAQLKTACYAARLCAGSATDLAQDDSDKVVDYLLFYGQADVLWNHMDRLAPLSGTKAALVLEEHHVPFVIHDPEKIIAAGFRVFPKEYHEKLAREFYDLGFEDAVRRHWPHGEAPDWMARPGFWSNAREQDKIVANAPYDKEILGLIQPGQKVVVAIGGATESGWTVHELDRETGLVSVFYERNGETIFTEVYASAIFPMTAPFPTNVPNSPVVRHARNRLIHLQMHEKLSAELYQKWFAGAFKQGTTGDCYLLAGLIGEKLSADDFEVLIRTSVMPTNYGFEVTLPLGDPKGKKVPIFFGDLLELPNPNFGKADKFKPKLKDERSTLNLASGASQKGVRLLEVLLNKFSKGNFRNSALLLTPQERFGFEGGRIVGPLFWLLGHQRVSSLYDFDAPLDQDEIKNVLKNFHPAKQILGVGTKSHETDKTFTVGQHKLIYQHAEVVTGVAYDYRTDRIRSVTVTNPHDSAKPRVMSYADFLAAFEFVTIIHIDAFAFFPDYDADDHIDPRGALTANQVIYENDAVMG